MIDSQEVQRVHTLAFITAAIQSHERGRADNGQQSLLKLEEYNIEETDSHIVVTNKVYGTSFKVTVEETELSKDNTIVKIHHD